MGLQEPRPTHASQPRTLSRANFTRSISHTRAPTLHTHRGAHVLTHTPTHRLTGAHTFSRTFTRIPFTHTLPHTLSLSHSPLHIFTLLHSHSQAYSPHSSSETPTRFTYPGTHTHTHTHVLLLIFALFTHLPTHTLASHTPRVPRSRTYSFSRSRTLHTRWRTQIHAKFSLGHTRSRMRTCRGEDTSQSVDGRSLGPLLVAVFSGCGFSTIP